MRIPVVPRQRRRPASAGTTVRISSDVTGPVAFVGQFAQHGVANYGVQVGVNVALGQSSSAEMPVKAHRP
jgi:hypothetical protein